LTKVTKNYADKNLIKYVFLNFYYTLRNLKSSKVLFHKMVMAQPEV
jgi:hypothetical protein